MSSRTAWTAFAVAAGASLAAVLWLRAGGDAPAAAVGPRIGSDEAGAPVRAPEVVRREGADADADAAAAMAAEPFAAALTALQRAIAVGEAAAAAADLRRLLRTDPGALAEAYATLLDDDTDAELRRALAMVLGTLPLDGVDLALLAALERFDDDEATVVALIAALGALRDPPDEDDVFDLDAAPFFGVAGPGGMGITVRNVIRDPQVEQTLGQLLLDRDRRDVRLAAASALQWSLDQELSRTRFRTALQNEMDDTTAAVLGEALGIWSRRKAGLEPDLIVSEVVGVADRPGFAEFRLRVETALQQAPLGELTEARLRQWTHPGNPFELRSFAFTALALQRTVDAVTRAALVAAVDSDSDIAMRRHAARLLAELPGDEDTIAALRRAFTQQIDWGLRATALTALVGVLPAEAARSLLQSAAADPDPRIVRRARRLESQVR